jgi:hypothetical protein
MIRQLEFELRAKGHEEALSSGKFQNRAIAQLWNFPPTLSKHIETLLIPMVPPAA